MSETNKLLRTIFNHAVELPDAEQRADYLALACRDNAALRAHATEWAQANTGLELLDLQVLSANEPAVGLYLRAGFVKVGEVAEMFKIDGRLFSETTMTKRLRDKRDVEMAATEV